MLKCKVVPLPGREISGILPNNKRISGETVLCLNKREILKCMKNAIVYGIRLDNSEVMLTDSESINREIMNKVEEKKESQHSILDITGTTREERKEIVKNVNEVNSQNTTENSNKNENTNGNSQNYRKNNKNNRNQNQTNKK